MACLFIFDWRVLMLSSRGGGWVVGVMEGRIWGGWLPGMAYQHRHGQRIHPTHTHKHPPTPTHTYTHIYIHTCKCIYLCGLERLDERADGLGGQPAHGADIERRGRGQGGGVLFCGCVCVWDLVCFR